MKRLIYSLLILLAMVFFLSSCDDDKYIDWKMMNEEWMQKNIEQHKDDPLFVQTDSGLFYKVIYQGDGRRPNSNSIIKVRYKGELINGTVFENTKDKAVSFALSSLMKGWVEGVTKMKVGDGIFYIFLMNWLMARMVPEISLPIRHLSLISRLMVLTINYQWIKNI